MQKIHVSYRLPISFETKGGKKSPKPSAGGLATALISAGSVGDAKDLWLGIADISKEQWESLASQIHSDFTLVPVFLAPTVDAPFYKGFSNSVLWPLFHYFPSFVEFKDDYLDAYKQANEEMAKQVIACYKEGDLIWIHDYHFLLLPQLVRKALPEANIGFFLHIPFPNFEVFRLLPTDVKTLLLQGVMGSSLIGFQTWGYASNFTECVQKVLGRSHSAYLFEGSGHSTKVGVFPISIDFDKFSDAYDDPATVGAREELRREFGDVKIIFSVDRLDYTKGVMYRLHAFDLFLEQHPEWRGKVVFILVIVPSREEIQKYWERRQMIEQNIIRINRLHGNYHYTPIVYHYRSISFAKLTGFFSFASLALISPVRDGMNLVAKEFVATRKDQKGVLMLSELTGAADELREALLFNPLDTKQMAEQIHSALTMPEQEQMQRMQRMQAYLRKHDVFHWVDHFLSCLKETSTQKPILHWIDSTQTLSLLAQYFKAEKRLILLDYDGTLMRFFLKPELAEPTLELKDLLARLARHTHTTVAIVSGRDQQTMERWFGDLPIELVAEHGAFVKQGTWKAPISRPPAWREDVCEMMTRFAESHEGSFVEKKPLGIVWHYRNMDERSGFEASRALIGQLKSYLLETKAVVLDGNKVVEVKSSRSDKGQVLVNLFDRNEYDFVMAIGDDRTDEDLFEVLDDGVAFTIKVGPEPTKARYRLQGVAEVIALLSQLAAAFGRTP
jgi:trehalose 6-phosphate synthase/phosphatase